MGLLWAACLWAAGAGLQESRETRFHRVHLRNGNFVDGDIIREDRRDVTVKLKAGEISIRRDQIDRIELVKMRSIGERPRELRLAVFHPPEPAPRAAREPAAEGTLEAIVADLERADGARRYALLARLVQAGRGSAPELARRMGARGGVAREFLAEALRQLQEREALPVLKSHLGAREPDLRAAAARLVGELGGAADAPELHALLSDRDEGVRREAAGALGKLGNRASFGALVGLAADPDPEVRARALRGAAELARAHGLGRELEEALIRTIDFTQGPARAEAVEALGRSGEKALGARLARLLSDEDPQVRTAAAGALAELGAAGSGPALLERMGVERDYWPRIRLADAAARLKLPEAVAPLIGWLDDADVNIRMAASRALRELTGLNFGLDAAKWKAWREGRP